MGMTSLPKPISEYKHNYRKFEFQRLFLPKYLVQFIPTRDEKYLVLHYIISICSSVRKVICSTYPEYSGSQLMEKPPLHSVKKYPYSSLCRMRKEAAAVISFLRLFPCFFVFLCLSLLANFIFLLLFARMPFSDSISPLNCYSLDTLMIQYFIIFFIQKKNLSVTQKSQLIKIH